ncbi:MAG: succinate dehydrogenase, hydrophobic membrane anchor protein [Gammaproteobacteria bacterium]
MVTQATALSRTGVSDWIIQRVSAVILSLYTLCVVAFVLTNPGLGYVAWVEYFTHPAMKIFTLLALTSLCAHAWIGMWAIGGDYLREHLMGPKATTLRFVYQIGCVLITIAYFLWGINILWGN